jgi:hypothetical protein
MVALLVAVVSYFAIAFIAASILGVFNASRPSGRRRALLYGLMWPLFLVVLLVEFASRGENEDEKEQ